MWMRFTHNARVVVFYAQEEAGKIGQNQVGPEHMLAGLVRDKETIAVKLLGKSGVTPEAIQSELALRMARGQGRLGNDMQLTQEAKQAIDKAYEEAKGLKNDYIGTEHLLLGLLHGGEDSATGNLAFQILQEQGINLETVRQAVQEVQLATPSTNAKSGSNRIERKEAP
jgi:ATP-dependent Clp protease ATP-binding subunit ClpC